MAEDNPSVVILAGPNGAGKSTAAPRLLRDELEVDTFVNADVIAQGLSGFSPAAGAMRAGRIMLEQLDELEQKRADFAFETTLATRSFVPRLRRMIASGYQLHLIYLWIPSPSLAIHRVAQRVRQGGHDVPMDWIRRRYERGLNNFFKLYIPIAHNWWLLDNTTTDMMPIASGGSIITGLHITDDVKWGALQRTYSR